MKLEEGMYVRTKVGIFKIRKITKDLAYWKHEKRVIKLDRNIPEYNYSFLFYKDESIFKGAKFSSNLIDLIKAGDYVNGKEVMAISEFKDGSRYIEFDEGKYLCKNYQIKSIVTKEQFKSMKYEVNKNE